MKNNWDEENIERLLSQAPKIHDHRSKEDVLVKLRAAGAFEEQQRAEVKLAKRPNKRLASFLAAAVALIVIGYPVYTSLDSQPEQNEVALDMRNEQADEPAVTNFSAKEEGKVEDGAMATRSTMPIDSTPIYEETIGDSELFTISVESKDHVNIPSAIVIPKEKIAADFGKEKPTQVELYNQYAKQLDEQSFGFDDTHPIKGELTEKERTIIHKTENVEEYEDPSFIQTVRETFPQYENVVAKEDEKTDAKPISLDQKYSYYLYTQNDKKYYVQQPIMSYSNVQEALLNMAQHATEQYESAIINGITYTVVVDDYAHVKFDQLLDLDKMDYMSAKHMIEAMILTAATFDKQVVFENIVQTMWDRFDFTQPQQRPLAPNELPLEMIK